MIFTYWYSRNVKLIKIYNLADNIRVPLYAQFTLHKQDTLHYLLKRLHFLRERNQRLYNPERMLSSPLFPEGVRARKRKKKRERRSRIESPPWHSSNLFIA